MSDIIFEDVDTEGTGMSFESFVDVLLNMRGSNPATVKDTKELLKVSKAMMYDVKKSILAEMSQQFANMRTAMMEIRDTASDDEDSSRELSREPSEAPSRASRSAFN